MIYITPDKYDAYYFNGHNEEYKHNGGYGDYTTEEQWCIWVADKLVEQFPNLVGKRIVDIGCAYGYTVKRLRELGVLAFGRDVSSYAISQADPSISQYLEVGDALDPYPSQVKIGFSSRLLACFNEEKVLQCVDHFNTSFDNQLHILDAGISPRFYLSKDMNWWTNLNWNTGTRLIDWYNRNQEIIK